MVPVEQLKKIFLMQRLTDSMLEKISPLVDSKIFEEKDFVLEQGRNADYFMMLRSGKVLLKVDASASLTIALGAVKQGYSFGWSALFPGKKYTSHAVCSEKSEIYAIKGEQFLGLMEADHDMGFAVFQGVTRILEDRLERRTNQFLKTLTRHIALESILS